VRRLKRAGEVAMNPPPHPDRVPRRERRPTQPRIEPPSPEEIQEARALLARHWAPALGLERASGTWWQILGHASGEGLPPMLPGDDHAITFLWKNALSPWRPIVWTALRHTFAEGLRSALNQAPFRFGLEARAFLPRFLAGRRHSVMVVWQPVGTGVLTAMAKVPGVPRSDAEKPGPPPRGGRQRADD
jgi:hypothetical protein